MTSTIPRKKPRYPYDWLAILDDELCRQTDALRVEAQSLVDTFWMEHYRVRHESPFGEWGKLGVRVRSYVHTFGIEWYINTFIFRGDKRLMFSKTLVRNKRTGRYHFNDCKRQAKDWELILAKQLETEMGHIRRQLDAVNRLRRVLHGYQTPGKKPQGYSQDD